MYSIRMLLHKYIPIPFFRSSKLPLLLFFRKLFEVCEVCFFSVLHPKNETHAERKIKPSQS